MDSLMIGLADPVRRLDFAGPGRAGAIVIGLGTGVWGYGTIKFRRKSAERQGPPRLKAAE